MSDPARNPPRPSAPSSQGRGVHVLAGILAASAGCVDAIGFLQFEEVFVSFMSGNSTQFGVEVAQGAYRNAALSALPIALFVAGSCLGALVAHFAGRRAFCGVLLLEVALLTLAVVLPHQRRELSATFALVVLAMGTQNAALGRTSAAGVGVTYVTGTLAKLGREIAAFLVGKPQRARQLRFHAVLWLSFVGGGLLGGVTYTRWALEALTVPIAILVVLLVWSVLTPFDLERRQGGTAP